MKKRKCEKPVSDYLAHSLVKIAKTLPGETKRIINRGNEL
jgi:hypothetical protein